MMRRKEAYDLHLYILDEGLHDFNRKLYNNVPYQSLHVPHPVHTRVFIWYMLSTKQTAYYKTNEHKICEFMTLYHGLCSYWKYFVLI